MAREQRTTRNGIPGKIVHVAPRGGYDRFVPDKYEHPQRKKK